MKTPQELEAELLAKAIKDIEEMEKKAAEDRKAKAAAASAPPAGPQVPKVGNPNSAASGSAAAPQVPNSGKPVVNDSQQKAYSDKPKGKPVLVQGGGAASGAAARAAGGSGSSSAGAAKPLTSDEIYARQLQEQMAEHDRIHRARLARDEQATAAFLAQANNPHRDRLTQEEQATAAFLAEEDKARRDRLAKEEQASAAFLAGFQNDQKRSEEERKREREAREKADAELAKKLAGGAPKINAEAGNAANNNFEPSLQHREFSVSALEIARHYSEAHKRWTDKKPKHDPKAADAKKYAEDLKAFEENKKKTLESLTAARAHPSVAGERNAKELMDAHKYTESYIRPTVVPLLNLDDDFTLTDKNLLADVVLAEVTKFLADQHANEVEEQIRQQKFGSALLDEKKKTQIEETAANIQKYLKQIENINTTFARVKAAKATTKSEIDKETNLHIDQFVSRNWSLAIKLGHAYKLAIATAMSDNIADKGGCTAGLMARLFATYVVNMSTALDPAALYAGASQDNVKPKESAAAKPK